MKRNGYIDIIKFIFAVIVAEFHLGTGIFPGGRLAVEGFYMITGFLMLKSAERQGVENSNLGIETVNFIWRKYKSLFYYLFPAVILNYTLICLSKETPFLEAVKKAPLLFFDIVPLKNAGFGGEYVLGISWYISSMFIALAILYPLAAKFKQKFTLTVCPLIVCLGYGILSHSFGNLAIHYQYIPETMLNSGIVRALAGCALGCLIYEISKAICKRKPTVLLKVLFTFLELLLITYCFCVMHYKPKSSYDYLLIFVIFAFLTIGINGLSLTSYLWNPKWTKYFGIASTLIVLTHYRWVAYLKKILGSGYQKTYKAFWYVLAVLLSCFAVYTVGILLKKLFAKLSKIKLWEN